MGNKIFRLLGPNESHLENKHYSSGQVLVSVLYSHSIHFTTILGPEEDFVELQCNKTVVQKLIFLPTGKGWIPSDQLFWCNRGLPIYLLSISHE